MERIGRSVLDDREDVLLADDEELLALDLELGAGVLGVEDLVASLTSIGSRLPSSVMRPGPAARIVPSWGFSLAVSGRTMPLLVISSAGVGWMTTRSPSGRSFVVAVAVANVHSSCDGQSRPLGWRSGHRRDRERGGDVLILREDRSNATRPGAAGNPRPCTLEVDPQRLASRCRECQGSLANARSGSQRRAASAGGLIDDRDVRLGVVMGRATGPVPPDEPVTTPSLCRRPPWPARAPRRRAGARARRYRPGRRRGLERHARHPDLDHGSPPTDRQAAARPSRTAVPRTEGDRWLGDRLGRARSEDERQARSAGRRLERRVGERVARQTAGPGAMRRLPASPPASPTGWISGSADGRAGAGLGGPAWPTATRSAGRGRRGLRRRGRGTGEALAGARRAAERRRSRPGGARRARRPHAGMVEAIHDPRTLDSRPGFRGTYRS